jgi:hypothetical protein
MATISQKTIDPINRAEQDMADGQAADEAMARFLSDFRAPVAEEVEKICKEDWIPADDAKDKRGRNIIALADMSTRLYWIRRSLSALAQRLLDLAKKMAEEHRHSEGTT